MISVFLQIREKKLVRAEDTVPETAGPNFSVPDFHPGNILLWETLKVVPQLWQEVGLLSKGSLSKGMNVSLISPQSHKLWMSRMWVRALWPACRSFDI